MAIWLIHWCYGYGVVMYAILIVPLFIYIDHGEFTHSLCSSIVSISFIIGFSLTCFLCISILVVDFRDALCSYFPQLKQCSGCSLSSWSLSLIFFLLSNLHSLHVYIDFFPSLLLKTVDLAGFSFHWSLDDFFVGLIFVDNSPVLVMSSTVLYGSYFPER